MLMLLDSYTIWVGMVENTRLLSIVRQLLINSNIFRNELL